ncbi:MAG: prepilin-type N-terminal cleavage/methylation domain-containing protein [Candidatus Omnitrophica bacterium]|nr:prepilin-type N-terminal cleavage/methylation domain-containing protein [Candidatus Omnitrophota bacterium]
MYLPLKGKENMLQKSNGFTMVELMVVCLIIGILVTIAIPNYARSVERAKCSQAMHNIKTLRSAAIDFYAENQTFVGATRDVLATRVGANFDDNTDWTYNVTTQTAGAWTLTATRRGGHWASVGQTTITLNQDETWGGTYNFNDPGDY